MTAKRVASISIINTLLTSCSCQSLNSLHQSWHHYHSLLLLLCVIGYQKRTKNKLINNIVHCTTMFIAGF